jgi:hypothetical protein
MPLARMHGVKTFTRMEVWFQFSIDWSWSGYHIYIFLKSSQETLQVCPWNRLAFSTSRQKLDTSRGCSNIAASWYWALTRWKSDARKHGHASLRPRWIWFHGLWVQKREDFKNIYIWYPDQDQSRVFWRSSKSSAFFTPRCARLSHILRQGVSNIGG